MASSDLAASMTDDHVLHPELWSRIFECMIDTAGRYWSSAALKDVVRVCKSWKSTAEPVLYRHLVFSDLPCLSRFAAHIVWQCHANSRDLGGWTHPLVITPSDPPAKLDSSMLGVSMPSLLLHFPRLQNFSCMAPTTAHAEITSLASVCKTTLRKLHISISGRDALSGFVLGVLQELSFLEDSDIENEFSRDVEIFPVAAAPGWFLPRLKRLQWITSRRPPLPASVAFLSRCRFPSLKDLILDMFMDEDQVLVLAPFFSFHDNIYTLNTPLDGGPLYALLRHAKGVRALELLAVPDPAVPLHLPLSVSKLTFVSSHDHPEALAGLGSFVATVTGLVTPPRLNTIVLRDWRGFSWNKFQQLGNHVGPHEYELLGRMLHYLTVLQAKGVDLADADGKIAHWLMTSLAHS